MKIKRMICTVLMMVMMVGLMPVMSAQAKRDAISFNYAPGLTKVYDCSGVTVDVNGNKLAKIQKVKGKNEYNITIVAGRYTNFYFGEKTQRMFTNETNLVVTGESSNGENGEWYSSLCGMWTGKLDVSEITNGTCSDIDITPGHIGFEASKAGKFDLKLFAVHGDLRYYTVGCDVFEIASKTTILHVTVVEPASQVKLPTLKWRSDWKQQDGDMLWHKADKIAKYTEVTKVKGKNAYNVTMYAGSTIEIWMTDETRAKVDWANYALYDNLVTNREKNRSIAWHCESSSEIVSTNNSYESCLKLTAKAEGKCTVKAYATEDEFLTPLRKGPATTFNITVKKMPESWNTTPDQVSTETLIKYGCARYWREDATEFEYNEIMNKYPEVIRAKAYYAQTYKQKKEYPAPELSRYVECYVLGGITVGSNKRQVQHAREISKELKLDGLSDMDKVNAIVMYGSMNKTYDDSNCSLFDCDWANCDEWAEWFSTMCRVNNIPCFKALSSTHEWNVLLIDGKWYAKDMANNNGRSRTYCEEHIAEMEEEYPEIGGTLLGVVSKNSGRTYEEVAEIREVLGGQLFDWTEMKWVD